MFTFLFAFTTLVFVDNKTNDSFSPVYYSGDVIYEAHTECELRDFGTIMECISYELYSGKVSYTVCTIHPEHGTVCIDYE